MKNRIALKITLIYFLAGFIWILFSDRFILSLGGSADATTILQTYKGWFYVAVTSLLLFFLIRDEIRKENKIKEELRKAKIKAEESDLLKSAFLSNISHQVRTPLNGILGFCELIVDHGYTPEEKEIFAQNMDKNAKDLLKLINDIIDIARIQGNQFEIDKGRFDLNQLFDLIYNHYTRSEPKIIQNQVAFELHKAKPQEVFEIHSDANRLMAIMQNLLNNALAFTAKGVVKYGYQMTDNGIEIFVEDTGRGIDAAQQELIFKPFFKGKEPIAGSKGFGLGLAISKGLVRLLGSDLMFTSTPGEGTRFFFVIDKSHFTTSNVSPGKSKQRHQIHRHGQQLES